MKQFAENLLKNAANEETRQQIRQSMENIELKWTKLNRTVESRISVASEYLQFIKTLNQFRNLTLDLQELFKTMGVQNLAPNAVLEHHVQEKLNVFEKLYHELNSKGTRTITLLRNVIYY